ncbi:recombinase family protein [Acidocella aromatica]|uniref:DNA invertase Pin-like site-specific DNA recombinase n=1 Tax=Acidocella aromatica TaxID=1303579 RepID=A0A840V9S6_9PROT|nr:recombinase family protein [Acidocella aromatica]MBB5372274.1 DNA invertase Pin-like site-specific DNA recombinase [Acidocella aromatica]
MAQQTFISYFRVSTEKQGRSGLGLEAQQQAVSAYLDAHPGKVLASFVEVESGKRSDRPELAKALAACKLKGATLIVAKLDRLARNARFLLSVVEGTGEGGVVFCDMPQIPAGPVGKFLVTQMAAVGELEAGLISARTKAALAAAKARGRVLGGYRGGPKADPARAAEVRIQQADAFAARVRPLVDDLQSQGLSLRQIAARLTEEGVETARGGAWTADAVRRVMLRGARS